MAVVEVAVVTVAAATEDHGVTTTGPAPGDATTAKVPN
jgi:hypothetical protein